MSSTSQRISTTSASSLLCDDIWFPLSRERVIEWVAYFAKYFPIWAPQLSTLVDDLERGRRVQPTMLMDLLVHLRDRGRRERAESDQHGYICGMIAILIRAVPTLYPYVAEHFHAHIATAHHVVADACWVGIAHGEDNDAKTSAAFWVGADRLTPRGFQIGFRCMSIKGQGAQACASPWPGTAGSVGC
jgi:hypothetical protein